MSVSEAKDLRRQIRRNKGKPVHCDYRFCRSDLEEQLASVEALIDEKTKGLDSYVFVLLNLTFIQRFAVYQILRDTNSRWKMFIFRGAMFDLSKAFNRAFLSIFKEMTTDDAKAMQREFLELRLQQSLEQLERRANGENL